jgi:hypothetical protein
VFVDSDAGIGKGVCLTFSPEQIKKSFLVGMGKSISAVGMISGSTEKE